MMADPLLSLSPLPSVDLDSGEAPSDGLLLRLPDVCRKSIVKTPRCQEHYQQLTKQPNGSLVQCPQGFASYRFRAGDRNLALTGFIPYPRLGGDGERRQAKAYPRHKTETSSVEETTRAVQGVGEHLRALETETIRKYSLALHEIRKLNRNVKQTAERLAKEESPDNPDRASRPLVSIWKTAELMSQQFDVLEILANEDLARLPLNSAGNIYKIFDKCARIYSPDGSPHDIKLHAPSTGFSAKVRFCDKTIPIIPTVLLQNAVKYSLPMTDVRVDFLMVGSRCRVSVLNYTKPNSALNDSVFERGVRASGDSEGSGIGLYVAQLVAAQHGTRITVQVSNTSATLALCRFEVEFAVEDE